MSLKSANRWLSIPFALLLVGAAWAQSESQIESDEVRRVGSHLTCQCGCKDNVNCMMSGGQCPVCKPMRTKIFKMQQGGMDDSAIVAAFVKEMGEKVFRPDPGSSFWLVPYFTLGAAGLGLTFILMRLRDRGQKDIPVPAAAGRQDAALARYRDAIEKETCGLD
ncbi:MAG TPA: cytochrome c-type biogenesis protein CcmH [Bryobacteraceae bacterium]|nr:cytochrome c-type biogenesis protein CcmH [Bryobacteraceae bacterium]